MIQDQMIELFVKACDAPTLFVQTADYSSVCAFVDGFDMALGGTPLMGFREWLLIGGARWSNLPWWALVRLRADPDAQLSEAVPTNQQVALIRKLREDLIGFANEYRAGGPARIYYQYAQWVLAQTAEDFEYPKEKLQSDAG